MIYVQKWAIESLYTRLIHADLKTDPFRPVSSFQRGFFLP